MVFHVISPPGDEGVVLNRIASTTGFAFHSTAFSLVRLYRPFCLIHKLLDKGRILIQARKSILLMSLYRYRPRDFAP